MNSRIPRRWSSFSINLALRNFLACSEKAVRDDKSVIQSSRLAPLSSGCVCVSVSVQCTRCVFLYVICSTKDT
jgi:hypothetical protein